MGQNPPSRFALIDRSRFRITYTENKAQLKTKEKAKPKQALLHISMKPVF